MRKTFYLLVFLVQLFAMATRCVAQGGNDGMWISKEKTTGDFHLHYTYGGMAKELKLNSPATDSAFITSDILYLDGNKNIGRSSVRFGGHILVCVSDFDYPVKKALFCIDRSANKVLWTDKPAAGYLETGLLFFLVAADKTIITSNTLYFTDALTEKATFNYYQPGSNGVKLIKRKTVVVTEKEMHDPEIFESKRVIGKIYQVHQ